MTSLLLRGGLLVDGTGGPARRADIAIEGDRIAAVGEPGTVAGGRMIDLDGLVVAPGFIDVHTHYDAQILWDRDLTPSGWHGVTTVVMGNCGFGIAPTRPGDRGTIARILENVEGMTLEVLEAGIPWTFETFPEYLAAVAAEPVRLNVGAMLGHTPLRLYVLGDDVERPATPAEVGEMRRLLGEALDAGALGFATSLSPTHVGAGGRPVPSRFADPRDEVFALAAVLGKRGRGVLQVTPGPGLFMEQFSELSRSFGRPVTWTALLTGMNPKERAVDVLERGAAFGGDVWPQVACRPIVMQLNLADPFAFGTQPTIKEILALPRDQRAALYADPAWRDRARPELTEKWSARWAKTTVQETDVHRDLVGRTLVDIAAERHQDPFDVLIDLSLAENLQTRFRIVILNDDEEELARLLADQRTLIALSDAGAHASQLCDACFSTHLLQHWVREKQVLRLEEAVRRLTSHPAAIFQIPDRGRVAPGWVADLVAFDPDTVGVEDLERVWDLPAGADRLIARSTGVEHGWVNGTAVRADGKDLDARPGGLIRAR